MTPLDKKKQAILRVKETRLAIARTRLNAARNKEKEHEEQLASLNQTLARATDLVDSFGTTRFRAVEAVDDMEAFFTSLSVGYGIIRKKLTQLEMHAEHGRKIHAQSVSEREREANELRRYEASLQEITKRWGKSR
jgi:chromosome segregation ATPase